MGLVFFLCFQLSLFCAFGGFLSRTAPSASASGSGERWGPCLTLHYAAEVLSTLEDYDEVTDGEGADYSMVVESTYCGPAV